MGNAKSFSDDDKEIYEMLQTGTLFDVFVNGSKSQHEVWLDPKKGCINWCPVGEEKQIRDGFTIPLTHVTDIMMGVQSSAFRWYSDPHVYVHDELDDKTDNERTPAEPQFDSVMPGNCFSVVYNNNNNTKIPTCILYKDHKMADTLPQLKHVNLHRNHVRTSCFITYIGIYQSFNQRQSQAWLSQMG